MFDLSFRADIVENFTNDMQIPRFYGRIQKYNFKRGRGIINIEIVSNYVFFINKSSIFTRYYGFP